MLIKTDDNQVKINAEGEVIRTQHEFVEADKLQQKRDAATIAPDAAGMDLTSSGARMGRPMAAWSFKEKLSKIGHFYFEVSKADPTKIGIYVAIHGVNDPKVYHRGNLMFCCGMESGVMPEFSIIEAEVSMVPDPEAPGGRRAQPTMAKEVRGWRTVLAMLLKKHIITAYHIEKHFQIAMGRDSQRWQQLLAGEIDLISDSLQITEEVNGKHNRDDERANDRNTGDSESESSQSETEAGTETGIALEAATGQD